MESPVLFFGRLVLRVTYGQLAFLVLTYGVEQQLLFYEGLKFSLPGLCFFCGLVFSISWRYIFQALQPDAAIVGGNRARRKANLPCKFIKKPSCMFERARVH